MSPAPFYACSLPGDSALLGTAIHDGHRLRPSLESFCALGRAGRLREEDPFTRPFAELCPEWLAGCHSRFEVDLNRPPSKAVYRRPEDAWGLRCWKGDLPEEEREQSLSLHRSFYRMLKEDLLRRLVRHERLLVLDFHSYNHRRDGRDTPPADPAENPEINIGTGALDLDEWGDLLEAFVDGLRERGRDTRLNVKFNGGYLNRRLVRTGKGRIGVFSVEYRKDFMDEWTGELDHKAHQSLLQDTKTAVQQVLTVMGEE